MKKQGTILVIHLREDHEKGENPEIGHAVADALNARGVKPMCVSTFRSTDRLPFSPTVEAAIADVVSVAISQGCFAGDPLWWKKVPQLVDEVREAITGRLCPNPEDV